MTGRERRELVKAVRALLKRYKKASCTCSLLHRIVDESHEEVCAVFIERVTNDRIMALVDLLEDA